MCSSSEIKFLHDSLANYFAAERYTQLDLAPILASESFKRVLDPWHERYFEHSTSMVLQFLAGISDKAERIINSVIQQAKPKRYPLETIVEEGILRTPLDPDFDVEAYWESYVDRLRFQCVRHFLRDLLAPGAAIQYLSQPSWHVRRLVAATLGDYGDCPGVIDRLLFALDREVNPFVRVAIA